MSYEKPVVRDYGDVAALTADPTIGTDEIVVCNSVDICVSVGVKA